MNKKMTFEEANQALEKVIRVMETGRLSLDESMEQYAKACKLLAYCKKELDAYKGKIEDIHERLLDSEAKGDVYDV